MQQYCVSIFVFEMYKHDDNSMLYKKYFICFVFGAGIEVASVIHFHWLWQELGQTRRKFNSLL